MVLLQSLPHPALRSYIIHYLFASVDNTLEFGNLKQTLFPIATPGLCFYFPHKLMVEHGTVNTYGQAVYTGQVTFPMSISFPKREKIRGLMIYFAPCGFSHLFRLDISGTTDMIPNFFDIAGSEAKRFYEQLEDAKDFYEQVSIADKYFLKKLPAHDDTAQINEACRLITSSNGLLSIKRLAYDTNMSLNTLERKFTKRVGVSPKTFARFKRFHYALLLLNSSKPFSMSRIAQQCGYFDQAHFIKEFEMFTGMNPSSYHAEDYPVFHQFVLLRSSESNIK